MSDAACAVLKDGQLTAAIEEKKIARRDVRGTLPEQSMAACLQIAGLQADRIDAVALARPLPERETGLHLRVRALFPNARLVVVEHHMAHAASAYYVSPFGDAVVLTLDRRGDFRCGARWQASGNVLALDTEMYVPDSLGDLYGRVTELLGFTANADEHKVQWLSCAGDDRYVDVFEQMMNWNGGGDWLRLDRSWFDRDRVSMGGFSDRFFSAVDLRPDQPVPEKTAAHIAAGVQRAVERAVLRMAGDKPRLCLAGGLAMNALLIASLEAERDVFVQPAGGNAGTSIGAALYAWHVTYRRTERTTLGDLCLGPGYSAEQIKKVLENCKLRVKLLSTTDDLINEAVDQLVNNHIVAWMHGRMEFGPRALGNRSILASPLNPYSTENLNVYIKHRESFRKFAASVPAELCSEYFDAGPNSRYLATVGRVKPQHRNQFEAAILGDGFVRVHTVRAEENPLYYRLLQEAGRRTGLPVLYNTSFNLFGDPLVCTPRDAARSFYSSGIDAMFVGNFMLQK
jgi:carbamoyltransferase